MKLKAVCPSEDPNAACLVYLAIARPGLWGHLLQGTLSCFNCASWLRQFSFGFQILGKDKEMPLAQSYTVERRGVLFSLWESETVSQRPALSVQRKARVFPHSFLWLCFPEDVSSYFSESWRIPRGTVLAWILCFSPLLWRKWWWRVDERCWWYKKRSEI